MRTPKSIRQICVAAFVGLSAQCASAQFMTQHSAKFGEDGLVMDTLSGLTWLNLDVTRGLSYNDVAAELAFDPQFKDFRIANSMDVGALFHDAGFSVDIPSGNLSDPARLAANASFADAFNGIPPGTFPYFSNGELFIGNTLLPDLSPDSPYYYFNAYVAGVGYTSGTGTVATAFDDSTGPSRDVTVSWMSTWVVSTRSVAPIPEPSTYALMLAGLAAIGFAVRRRSPRT